jgi:Mg/Co/Ni transporter MgtE
MNSPSTLTLAFLERKPDSAAQVLEDLDPADAAAFLETVPVRLSAPVVRGTVPWAAARYLELLSPERAAALVRNLAFQDAASVLRLMEEERLEALFASLPKDLAKDFRNSLGYPKGTVGAWMDHSVPNFPAETSVADGLKYVKQRRNQVGGHILVVEEKGLFVGVASIDVLLRSSAKTTLAEVMDRRVSPLSNRAMLASVASSPEWDEYSMLPVIGRRKNILGGLTRKSLRKGLSEIRPAETPIASSSLWAHILATYLLTCAGLLRFISRPRAYEHGSAAEGNDHVG